MVRYHFEDVAMLWQKERFPSIVDIPTTGLDATVEGVDGRGEIHKVFHWKQMIYIHI